MEEFKFPEREPKAIPTIISYRTLGRRAVYPKKSWFGKMFDYLFGCDDVPKFIYKFEITVDIPEYLRMGTVISLDTERWYTELKNSPNRYTIVNLYPVDETIFHFESGTPIFGLYVTVEE